VVSEGVRVEYLEEGQREKKEEVVASSKVEELDLELEKQPVPKRAPSLLDRLFGRS